jgi:hypothetical protein
MLSSKRRSSMIGLVVFAGYTAALAGAAVLVRPRDA